MTREELLKSPEYWTGEMQFKLYEQINNYMKINNLTKQKLSEKRGITVKYISQILNGNFDGKISRLVEISLAIGKAPEIQFIDIEEIIENEISQSELNDAPMPIPITKRIKVLFEKPQIKEYEL